ncbi:MAG: hypothetical protein LBN18_05185 [Dysgonamonadaceae bacterium]|jgi:serine/threonine protein kinase|nr:hypothetical protein [Dysgonamonadaceae bacterium]
MKTVIHPAYQSLATFVENLPEQFDTLGEVIYHGRNELRKIAVGDQNIVVKSFRIPHWINRIAYTFFRPSKAERSYKYALRLLEKEIPTPAPVAYIVEKRNGLIFRSFYVCEYTDYPGLLRELDFRDLDEVRDLVTAFAHFTAFVHEQQVLHLDYSPGNILYEQKGLLYRFCLVDLNRIRFKKVSMRAGCFNLRRLWGTDEIMTHLAEIYAQDRGFNVMKCVLLTLTYFRKFWKRRAKRTF